MEKTIWKPSEEEWNKIGEKTMYGYLHYKGEYFRISYHIQNNQWLLELGYGEGLFYPQSKEDLMKIIELLSPEL